MVFGWLGPFPLGSETEVNRLGSPEQYFRLCSGKKSVSSWLQVLPVSLLWKHSRNFWPLPTYSTSVFRYYIQIAFSPPFCCFSFSVCSLLCFAAFFLLGLLTQNKHLFIKKRSLKRCSSTQVKILSSTQSCHSRPAWLFCKRKNTIFL